MADALTASDIARFQTLVETKGESGVTSVYSELPSKGYASADWALSEYHRKSHRK